MMIRRLALLVAASSIVSMPASSAFANPIYNVGANILGEGGPFYEESIEGSLSPVSVSGSHESNSASASAFYFGADASATSDGILATAGGSGKVNEIFFFEDELGNPILFGTVSVTASYSGSANGGGSANGFLSVFGLFDFDGADDFFSVSPGSDSGLLFAEWTGDFSEGVVIEVEAGAFSGGTTGGSANSFVSIQSIIVDGVPVFAIPEPSTAALMFFGALGVAAVRLIQSRRAC